MTTLTTKSPAAIAAAWAERAGARAKTAREGAWALERRRAAAATLGTLSLPRRDDELWRRTDMETLVQALGSLDPFVAPPAARNLDDMPVAVLERLAGETGRAALLVQRDTAVVLEQTHPTLQKQGVTVCSLDRATRDYLQVLAL